MGVAISPLEQLAAVREGGASAALLALAQFAERDVTVAEKPRGSNRGADLRKFFSADDYKPKGEDEGYPWCASAVSYWVQTWLRECPMATAHFGHITPPNTARAFGLSEWAKGTAAGCVQVITPAMLVNKVTRAMPGDLAVFHFSHCGIVLAGSPIVFTCVEGNTDAKGGREGWQVAKRGRKPSDLRHLLRFIPRAVVVRTPEPEANS